MSALLLCPSRPPPAPRQLKVRVEALLESSSEGTRSAQVCSGLLAKGTKPGQIRSRVVWARDRVGTLTPGHSREGIEISPSALGLDLGACDSREETQAHNHCHPSGMAAIVHPEGAGANPVGSNSIAPSWACCWPLPPPSPCPGSHLCLDHRSVILDAFFSLYTK